MILYIAIISATLNIILHPYSQGLLNTSLWVSKILMPSDTINSKDTKQTLKFNQAALMDGWLSNIPFISTILSFSAIILGFFYTWWMGIVFYVVIGFTHGTIDHFIKIRVSYFLKFIYHKMVNRALDYKVKNDLERSEAAESYCEELENLIKIYSDTNVNSPTKKQVDATPFGDIFHLYENS